MSVLKIYYSSRFIRELKKLSKKKQRLAVEREKIFKLDPFALTLKTHKLSGSLKDYWAFSLTYQDRVLFKFDNNDHTEVTFYKIGSHDIYK